MIKPNNHAQVINKLHQKTGCIDNSSSIFRLNISWLPEPLPLKTRVTNKKNHDHINRIMNQ